MCQLSKYHYRIYLDMISLCIRLIKHSLPLLENGNVVEQKCEYGYIMKHRICNDKF